MQTLFQSSEGWELVATLAGSANTQTHILKSYQDLRNDQKCRTYAFKTIAISQPISTKISTIHTINHKYKDLVQIKSEIKAYERLKQYQCIVQLHEILVQDDENEQISQFFRSFLKKQDQKGRYIAMITQYCPGGTLKNYLNQKPKLTEDVILQLAMQILECLLCLNEEGIIHRDVSTDNLLVTGERIKLSDFDTAFLRGYSDLPQLTVPVRENSSAPQLLALFTFNQSQKEQLSAEEMFSEQTKCDIYSFGAVLYELIVGTEFKKQSLRQLSESKNSKELKTLVFRMLEEEKQKRIEIQEISVIISQLGLKNGVQFRLSGKRQRKDVVFRMPEIVFHPSSCSQSKSNSLSLSDWSLQQTPKLASKGWQHSELRMGRPMPNPELRKTHHLTVDQ